MWSILGIIFVCFNFIDAQVKETYFMPDLADILMSDKSKDFNSTCDEHVSELGKGLKDNQEWALQMIDSMPKIPEGILVGHTVIPGVFDECVNAVNDKFSGRHCMPKLKVKDGNKSMLLGFSKNTILTLKFGICVPSTCNSTDVVRIFQTAQDNVEFLNNFEINITETDCATKEFRPFRTEDWVTVAVLSVIGVAALSSTIYDLKERFINKKQTPNNLWSSFSIYTNGKNLFAISQSAAQLKCLHGMRCLSMLWVIFGHTYFTVLLGAPFNAVEIPKFMKDKSLVPVTNGFLSVDSFFFLSGLLVCLVFFRDISKKKTFDVPVAFIHRYMRLTPPFALLMLIQSTILSRMGNGPFWNENIDLTERQCRESWWSGLLYLQNYIKPRSMCLGQAWYLSADMQMFWLSPLILYPLLWFPYFAPYFLCLLTLAAAFTNFAISFVNELAPNFLMGFLIDPFKQFMIFNPLHSMRFLIDPFKQFELEYVPFHTRMSPWLIGVATGYIICGIQAKKIRLNLSKTWVIAGWTASFFLLGASFLGILRFMGKASSEYSQLESSLYLAFHRVGWALGMGWVVVACTAGYGGPINTILSLDGFQILGRLSYCNFLVHMTIQYYRLYTSRMNPYLRNFDVVYNYFGDVTISHLFSIPVVLLLESPFGNLDRQFLRKLVIFPLPRPEKEKESEEKKAPRVEEKSEPIPEDLEKGKVNPAFNET